MSKMSLLWIGSRSVDSFADRLSCRLTVVILAALAVLTTFTVLNREPITCFIPPHFTDKQATFAEQTCWSSDSYIVPFRQEDYASGSFKISRRTSYHRWIPVLLALQALLFYIPKLLWDLGSSASGPLSFRQVTSAVGQDHQHTCNPELSSQSLDYMIRCLGRLLVEHDSRWKVASVSRRYLLLFTGNSAFILYLFVKVLYIVNVVGQLFLLNVFLGSDLYGFSVLSHLLSVTGSSSWETSPRLPRTFQCDFDIRSLGDVRKYSVDCSLPMNVWFEVVVLFLWLWFIFVAITTIGSLVCYVVSLMNVYSQKRYCRLRLVAMGKADETQRLLMSQFVQNFLTRDSWFIIQQIGRTESDQKATALLCGLWETYVAYKQKADGASID